MQVQKLRLLCGISALVMANGCDVEDSGGAWVYQPPPSSRIPQVTVSTPQTFEPVVMGAVTPAAEDIRFITCDIPREARLTVDSSRPVIHYIDAQDRVCLGEEAQTTASFCSEVRAFERWASAVASCFDDALQELDLQGSITFGDAWRAKAMPYLPKVWSRSPDDVAGLAHRVSTRVVELMTAGQRSNVAGAPVCFSRPAGWSVEQTIARALQELEWVIEDTNTELATVVGALRRGIHQKVDPDLTLRLSVTFLVHQPIIAPVGECRFADPTPR